MSIPEDIKSRFAVGHMAWNESKLVLSPEVQAAGAMYSTVNDLLKYVSANLGINGYTDQFDHGRNSLN